MATRNTDRPPVRPNLMTIAEIAYIAGLFDGEGTVGYYKKTGSGYHLAQAAIANNDPRVMRWLRERLPYGTITCGDAPTSYKGWQWRIASKKQVKAFLSMIRPFLVIKADQVDLLFSLWDAEQKMRGNHKLSPEILSLRDDTVQELKRLKKANFTSIQSTVPSVMGTPPTLELDQRYQKGRVACQTKS